MNLIVDVGNTQIKLAVFERNELKEKTVSDKKNLLNEVGKLIERYPKLEYGILSSVGRISEVHLDTIKKHVKLFQLDHEAKLPFQNLYITPKTLGVDRIALMSAAANQFPDTNVLVIDAGSCITYDFLNDKNEYLGGAIAPGIEMRYRAMNEFTANLPMLQTESLEKLVGDSTSNSMHIGVVQGVINEIDGFIRQYIEKFGNLTVILTGGDAHFLRDSIKNDIFANSNFLLEGLNHILEINKD